MKKKLFFTSRADAQKEANDINTYVSLVYDTETGELKLIDSFDGEIKEVTVATIQKGEEEETEEQP